MTIPLLREMHQERAATFEAVHDRLDTMDARLDEMDHSSVRFRHALGNDSLLSKIVTGDFEERLSDVERRLSDLETHK